MNASQIHPPTEARMEFDEWWKTYWGPTGQPAVFDAAMKEIAENSWAAATAAERERCARIAEGDGGQRQNSLAQARFYADVRRETAAEIRRRP